jgi:transcriptional regulator with XRE-family HTH domain
LIRKEYILATATRRRYQASKRDEKEQNWGVVMITENEGVVDFAEEAVLPKIKEAARKTEIDPESAEAFIAEKHIGERIKRLRLKKSMGLVELGRHTGLSASFLSQLETGRVVPTLRNLARIAMVFSKDLSYFFETEPSTLFRVHKKKERVRLPQSGVDDPTYYFESLGYMVPDRQLDPYYAEFIPLKKTTDVRPHVHPGYEFLYMLEGELEIRHADKVHTVETGDGVYFDASTPHAYRCLGKTSAVAIIVTMHQQASAQPAMNLRGMGAMMGSRSQASAGASASRGQSALQRTATPNASQSVNA